MRTLRLLNFTQVSERKFLLRFDTSIESAFAIFKNNVPGNIEVGPSSSEEKTALRKTGAKVLIDVPQSIEAQDNEYSIILVLNVGRSFFKRAAAKLGLDRNPEPSEPHFLEIVRQPPAWLKSTFGFESIKGYSILGRRTFDARPASRRPLPKIEFADTPEVDQILEQDVGALPKEIIEIPELLIASKIIKMLWDGEVHDSPTDESYSEFIRQLFGKKLRQIHRGEFPVSCQGIRDMFLHASLAFPCLRVRAVNAYNYTPQFADLIAYAHATAEVYVEKATKWVLTDPWTGFILQNKGGEYMSAQDIAEYNDRVTVIPLIEKIEQHHMGSNTMVSKVIRRPAEAEVTAYSFTPGGHVPDYRVYFRHLEYVAFRSAS
jgi:hypothetical protein